MAQIWIITSFGFGIFAMASTARILLIHPYFTKSHAVFNDAIAKSLLKIGHQITAITHFPESILHENYTAVDSGFTNSSNNTNIFDTTLLLNLSNSIKLMNRMAESGEERCYDIIQMHEVQQLMKSKEKPFDLVMIDIFTYVSECFLPIADLFKVPVIGTVTARSWQHIEWIMGNPYNPAVIPFDLSYNPKKMTFFQRIDNLLDCVVAYLYHNFIIYPKVEKIYKHWFPGSTVSQLKKPSLLFVNGHPVLNSKPLLPTIINIGGIHVNPEKPLPKNLHTFIDEADHGVILFSVGSLAQSHKMPITTLSIFKEVFAEIPQRVIWKAEENIESLSDNILLSAWLPQRDILAHKNVVAFISHCGISGTYETLYSGVPMIIMPLFFDQMSNAAILQELGIGIELDAYTMTKENLRQALNDIINGTKYRKRLKEISTFIRSQSQSPSEAVIFWTEYVLRHNGTEHMHTSASEMPLYQYLLLDIIGIILVTTCIAIFGSRYLIKFI